jgi:hypothetical protein
MKIKIYTERKIRPEDFWRWVHELRMSGVPIDGKILLQTGQWAWTTDLGYTKATTLYKIELEEEERELIGFERK